MKSHLEFISSAFPALPDESATVNPGRYGKRLAEYLANELPQRGFFVAVISAEDWGWLINLDNQNFPLWIGCCSYAEYENGFLCFIQPSRPFVRRLLKKIPTTETVERLSAMMQKILEQSGKVERMRWWLEEKIPGS